MWKGQSCSLEQQCQGHDQDRLTLLRPRPAPLRARLANETWNKWMLLTITVSLIYPCHLCSLGPEMQLVKFTKIAIFVTPHWALVPPFRICSSVVHSLPHPLLFFTFSLSPFLVRFTYFLLLSIHSLSTRIIPLRFQAGGHRRRPNLVLVCFVYFVLSLLCS